MPTGVLVTVTSAWYSVIGVDRSAAAAWQESVDGVAVRVDSDGVRARLGRYGLADRQAGGVRDVDDAGIADRDVQEPQPRVMHDDIRRTGQRKDCLYRPGVTVHHHQS